MNTIKKFNYGIIALAKNDKDPRRILHFAGYEEPLEQKDYEHLNEELINDPEFKTDEEFILLEAPKEVLDYYQKIFDLEIKPQINKDK